MPLSLEKSNFVIEDEINLKSYTKYYPEKSEGIYNLTTILCKYKKINEKYITYYINISNGRWYCYTEGTINWVEKIDINAIPLMLVYQIKNELPFNYKSLIKKNINIEEKNKNSDTSNEKIKELEKKLKEKNKNNDALNEKIKELEKKIEEEKRYNKVLEKKLEKEKQKNIDNEKKI